MPTPCLVGQVREGGRLLHHTSTCGCYVPNEESVPKCKQLYENIATRAFPKERQNMVKHLTITPDHNKRKITKVGPLMNKNNISMSRQLQQTTASKGQSRKGGKNKEQKRAIYTVAITAKRCHGWNRYPSFVSPSQSYINCTYISEQHGSSEYLSHEPVQGWISKVEDQKRRQRKQKRDKDVQEQNRSAGRDGVENY